MNKKKEPRFHGTVSEKSHKTMSHIRGKGTRIEKILCHELWKRGIHYRKNYRKLPGTPDIVLTKYHIAVFCDSEFFHGKDWENVRERVKKGKNGNYWVAKIERNMERDREKDGELTTMGWTVLHFWGDDIKKNTEQCVRSIEEAMFENSIRED